MTITTRDMLIDAMGNHYTVIPILKTTVTSQTTGAYASMWRATGLPAQGAIPSTAAACTKALAGSARFLDPVSPAKSYLSNVSITSSQSSTNFELHDRLAHMGGLSGTVITPQGALTLSGVSTARIGGSDSTRVQWWLEWYTDTGASVVNATVNVTFDDNSTANIVIALTATMRASRFVPIISGTSSLGIKQVNSVTLSATTGTAGNFGITATRAHAFFGAPTLNTMANYDWAALGLPQFESDACLFLVVLCGTTQTGNAYGLMKLAHG